MRGQLCGIALQGSFESSFTSSFAGAALRGSFEGQFSEGSFAGAVVP